MKFTAEQLKELEDLAALNFTVRQIAMYFDIPVHQLVQQYEETGSVFRYHYERGQLMAQAQIDKSNLESAKKGNITAMIRYDKKVRENKTSQSKERIFGRT